MTTVTDLRILTNCYSGIGRKTNQDLDNLRRQLGPGCDPAHDYTAMLELQKKLTSGAKQSTKQRSDRLTGQDGSAPTSGLDLLKKTLKEVVGVGAGIDDADSEHAEGVASNRRARSSPAEDKKQREAHRNTSSFQACTRESLKKMDIENRFRAPPIGSYRPKDEVMRPKQACHEFGLKEPTISRHTVAIEKEIERLQDAGEPTLHLTHPSVSIELKEGIVARAKSPMANYQMKNDLDRPDLLKLMNLSFQDNSFTAGILQGHNDQYPRLPAWDFAKTSTAEDKPRTYYFQPGQYEVHVAGKWDVAKSKTDLKNINFTKQAGHKVLKEVLGGVEIKKRITGHLPDRSLSRPSCIGASCPLLERKVKDISIGNCTNRKPPYEYVPPMYDASDPKVCEAVMNNHNAFNAFEAMSCTKSRCKPASEFKKSLTRGQAHKIMRSYATDLNIQLSNKYLTQGPVSTENLTLEEIHGHPALNRTVENVDIKLKTGRERTKVHKQLPSRGKVDDMERAMIFERGIRSGDSRAETANLSTLAGRITELRGARSYDALPRQEHPRPSVDLR